jgi:hypothetical protein
VILLVASNEKPFQLGNKPMFNSASVVRVAKKGIQKKNCEINYSTNVLHFKIRLFPRD